MLIFECKYFSKQKVYGVRDSDMKQSVIRTIIYTLIITVVFGSVFMLTEGAAKHRVLSADELETLRCDELCQISLDYTEIYNNHIYSHDDFANGKTVDAGEKTDFDHYLTYRFYIGTVPGKTYGFFSRKSDYAMNVFADGKLIASTGKVADNESDFIPSAQSPTGYFTATGEQTEIIVQQANFNHIKHYVTGITIGPSADISRYISLSYISRTAIFICLVTAGLMNLGMYFFFEHKRRFLFLACLCIAAAVNYATPYLLTFIFGDINWYVSHRAEYISKILISFYAAMYADEVFDGRLNRNLKICFSVYCTAGIAAVIVLPSKIYTLLCNYGAYVLAIILFMMLVNIIVSLKKSSQKMEIHKKLIIFGVAIVFVFSLVELFGLSGKTYNSISTETGIVVFAFLNTVALALDFKDTSRMLDEAKMREKELLQTNETMVKLGNMRDTFIADLSHELKTPLTVISNLSALSSYQIKNAMADEKTLAGLETIENEAVRLGKMVDKLKQKSITGFDDDGKKVEDLSATLKYAADFCEPLCKRNNNTIIIDCAANITADISEDLVFHILYNLIANASRHCRNSNIELAGKSENGKTTVTVTDHGDGMTGEEMKKAFDRGYSGDSGSGIGLALCKEIAEDNGGVIRLSDTPGGGLTVTIIFNGC